MRKYTLEEWFECYNHYDLSDHAKEDLEKVFALAVTDEQENKE